MLCTTYNIVIDVGQDMGIYTPYDRLDMWITISSCVEHSPLDILLSFMRLITIECTFMPNFMALACEAQYILTYNITLGALPSFVILLGVVWDLRSFLGSWQIL